MGRVQDKGVKSGGPEKKNRGLNPRESFCFDALGLFQTRKVKSSERRNGEIEREKC